MDEHDQGTKTTKRRLHKSADDRIIDGVCGGISEYIGVDSTVIRLLLVAFSIFSVGAGIVVYLVAMLVIPSKPAVADTPGEPLSHESVSAGGSTVTLVLGIIVVIAGVTLLFDYYDILPFALTFGQLGRLALPIIFILIGGALLLGKGRKGDGIAGTDGDGAVEARERNRLARSTTEKKIAGVCGGIAEYLKIDPTIVRLACVLLAFASFGFVLILYLACVLIIPKEGGK